MFATFKDMTSGALKRLLPYHHHAVCHKKVCGEKTFLTENNHCLWSVTCFGLSAMNNKGEPTLSKFSIWVLDKLKSTTLLMILLSKSIVSFVSTNLPLVFDWPSVNGATTHLLNFGNPESSSIYERKVVAALNRIDAEVLYRSLTCFHPLHMPRQNLAVNHKNWSTFQHLYCPHQNVGCHYFTFCSVCLMVPSHCYD